MMNIILKHLIKKYKVITFDIFDTLIERDIINPLDIFKIVGKEVLGREYADFFYNARIEAEKRARNESENREVTLDDIYNHMDRIYSINSEALKTEEIKQEIKHCVRKDSIHELFRFAISSGCTVYLISDMYLPKEVIEKILDKCGIKGYIKCFISNETGKNKISGGLFRVVINEEKLNKEDILHVGDSIKADFIGARKQGITSYLSGRKNRFRRMLMSLKR